MEGIMMRNKNRYAVAVRLPNKKIEIQVADCGTSNKGVRKIPFIRGIFNFVDSLVLGMKTLSYSAEFYEDADEKESGFDKFLKKIFGKNTDKVVTGFTVAISVIFAIGLFVVLPFFVASYLDGILHNASLLAIIEGVLRLVIFILYVLAISLMKDVRRVFQYHGAEHKCINCVEKGRPLTVRNVMRHSRFHRRCGTSFLLLVMLISIILFFFIRVDSMLLKMVLRIALVPVIAGISYEVLRLAGSHDNWLIRIISAPGIWLQGLTTKEPDPDMAEVAIAAVEAVFDWKAYLRENFDYDVSDSEEWLDEGDEEEENTESSQESTEAPVEEVEDSEK